MKTIYRIEVYALIALNYIKFLFQILLKNEDHFILDIAAYVLLSSLLITAKNNNRLWLIFVFAVISIFTPTARNVFVILLTTYYLGRLPLKNIVGANLIMQLLLFFIMLCLLFSGVVKSETGQIFNDDDRVDRWDFGYGNANRFSMFIYSILINIYIFFNDRKGIAFLAIVIICAIPVYFLTQSRTFILSLSILVISHYLIMCQSNFWLKHRNIFIFIPFVLLVMVFYFAYLVEEYPILDLLFMHRLSEYSRLIVNSSLIDYMIGNPMIVDESITIDSTYVHMVFEAGFLTVIIFMTMYYKTIKTIDHQRLFIIPLSLSVLAYGITESLLFFILNFGCMIYWSVLYDGYKKSLHIDPKMRNMK